MKNIIDKTNLVEVGVIHGRFQVLHNDHLKYLIAGKHRCRTLVVGITNPDPILTKKESSAPGRDDPFANPLTFYERCLLVKAVFQEHGIGADEFIVVPFPINFPEIYHHYIPLNALFFLTIYDSWGKKKLDYFQSLGLNIHVLWEVPPEQKGISATSIRIQMIENKPWNHLVPNSVAMLLNEWHIPTRLKRMRQK